MPIHITGKLGDRIHPHFHFEIRNCTTAPYDPGLRDVVRTPVENDLLDQAAQQRLAMDICGGWIRPDLRQTTTKGNDLVVERLAHRHFWGRARRRLFGKRCLGRPSLHQRALPSTLEFGGDKTVIRIDAIELPLRQSCSVSGALDFAFGIFAQRRVDLTLGPARARQGIEFGRRQCGQERARHSSVDARGSNTNRRTR